MALLPKVHLGLHRPLGISASEAVVGACCLVGRMDMPALAQLAHCWPTLSQLSWSSGSAVGWPAHPPRLHLGTVLLP